MYDIFAKGIGFSVSSECLLDAEVMEDDVQPVSGFLI